MPFLPGLELSRRFWFEAVRPVVMERLDLSHLAAALIGSGSEVLGYDTARSIDHGWGPRAIVFVPAGVDPVGLDRKLEARLPAGFAGYPVRFPRRDGHSPRHQVDVVHLDEWSAAMLGFDPLQPIAVEDWLATPTQLLAGATGGAVFEDTSGELTAAREALRWYPDEIWRYALACQWQRLGQHEHLMGRAAEVGDELGSRIVAARLARDLIRLYFLVERVWAPYDKWLGTAFDVLPGSARVRAELEATLASATLAEREQHIVKAMSTAAERFNALALVPPIDPTPRPFFGRPFLVLECGRFAGALMRTTSLAARGYFGTVDQSLDSVDAMNDHALRHRLLSAPPDRPKFHWQQPRIT